MNSTTTANATASSNATTTVAAQTVDLMQLLNLVINVALWNNYFVTPFAIFFGVPLSFLVIVAMPCAAIKPKPKMFYILFAVCNYGPQFFMHSFVYFSNVLSAASNGAIVWAIDIVSTAACQFSRFAVMSGESETCYLLILFAFERFVAVTFPFKAHMFTMKRSAICCAVIVVSLMAFNCYCFRVYGPAVGNIANAYCTPTSGSASLLFATYLVNITIPNCLLLVVALLTFVSLKRHQAKQMHSHSADGKPQKLKGRKTTVTMLALALIRCTVYVPSSILYVAWQFIPDVLLAYHIRIIANIFQMYQGLCCVFDFIVYVVQIPQFRRSLIRLLTCRPTCSAKD